MLQTMFWSNALGPDGLREQLKCYGEARLVHAAGLCFKVRILVCEIGKGVSDCWGLLFLSQADQI